MSLGQIHTTLAFRTSGPGFLDITGDIGGWLASARVGDGVVTLLIRHTSASLVIQENADPDVLTDLGTALDRLVPRDHPWRHDMEGPDDMPAHVRAMVTGASLSIPVREGRMMLGTWQAIYIAEHRDRPHQREVACAFIGALRG
ncbi:MAG: secondary thiamine-phosphate synthase enzyme YjbQ [Hyphomicrobiaceae bacterium]